MSVLTTADGVDLPRTGHCVNLEMPEAFNRLCLGFVDSVRAAGG